MESSPQAQIVNASNSHAKLISNQRVGLVSNEWIANQRYERSNDDPEKGRKRLFGLLHKPSTAEVAKKAKYKPLPDTSNRLTLEDYKSLDATSRDKIQLINDSKRTKKSDDEETSEGSMELDTLPFAVFPKSDNVVNKKRMKSDGSDSSLDIDALPLADVSSEPENFDIDTSTSSLDMTTESLPIEKNATSKIIEFSCETSRKYTIARKIGYTIVKNNGRDQIAYKCFCPGCPFVLNKAESFRTHLITDHSSLHWNRFCTACGDFVDLNRPNPILGILDEFNHIQTVHINAESLMKDKVPFKNIEPSEPTPLKTPQNSDESANKQSKMLRPWLNHPIWKHNIAAAMMMSENCLAAQYKCMEVKCVFFTSKEQHFEDHLRYHIKSRIAQGHFCCAYCCFEAPDSESLVAHLRKKHEFDIYCCKYCFYRSAAQVNVQTHLNVFHSDEEPVIIECIPRLRADNEAAKKFMESTSNIKKVIPRLHCFLCRDAFYLISGFKTHLESHKSYDPVKKFTCKCKLEIEFGSFLQHTEKCFKISSHQCGYCRFSSNTLEPLKLHYANKHATKLPYYLMRTEHENVLSCTFILLGK